MLKSLCGNVYNTSERNYQTLTRYTQKAVLAAILEGKSMPSNMAANTNDTPLLKVQSSINISLKCVSSQILGVR